MAERTSEKAAREDLRAEALAARRALLPGFRRQASELIAGHFLALPEVRLARVIALYLSLPDEVSTLPLLHLLRARPEPPLIVAPVVFSNRRMEFYPVPTDLAHLRPGPFGVPQPPIAGQEPVPPASIQVLALPGVAFDLAGHRLGYGAGYYDRYLAFAKRQEAVDSATLTASSVPLVGRPLLVGLTFVVQLLPAIPVTPHDIAVDLIVTEEGARRVPRA